MWPAALGLGENCSECKFTQMGVGAGGRGRRGGHLHHIEPDACTERDLIGCVPVCG